MVTTGKYSFHQSFDCIFSGKYIKHILYRLQVSVFSNNFWHIYMTFLHCRNDKKRSILLKIAFEVPLFFGRKYMNTQLLSTIMNVVYLFSAWSTNETFQKSYMRWPDLLLVFLFRFFNLLISRYCFLPTVLAPFKAD